MIIELNTSFYIVDFEGEFVELWWKNYHPNNNEPHLRNKGKDEIVGYFNAGFLVEQCISWNKIPKEIVNKFLFYCRTAEEFC